MRRTERQITSLEQIWGIMNDLKVCRLGMADQSGVYIVPMNFGYEYKEERLLLYFHCAGEGRKIHILKQNPKVGFEMDGSHKLIEGETPCSYSYSYESIIGTGFAEFLELPDEKIHALQCIMRQQAEREFLFHEGMAAAVTVFRVTADQFSCKKNSR